MKHECVSKKYVNMDWTLDIGELAEAHARQKSVCMHILYFIQE